MTSTKTIAITGAHGYLGSHLVSYFSKTHNVVSLTSDPTKKERFFALEKPLDPSILDGVDILIHCAYDFSHKHKVDIHRINVRGSIRLFEAAKSAGIKKIIFMSTFSAFEGSSSIYGKAKFEVEQYCKEEGIDIIRAGLLASHDPKGMLGSLKKIASLPFIPLIGGGKQKLYITGIYDLSTHLAYIIKQTKSKLYQIAYPTPYTLKEIMLTLSKRKPLFIPVPSWILYALLKTIEFLHIPVRASSDSLISLKNLNKDISITHIKGLSCKSLDEVLL